MKLNKLTLIYLTILVSLIGVFVLSPSASATLEVRQVKFEPRTFDLENPDSVIVHIKIFDSVTNKSLADQINPATVLLEDYIPIIEGSNQTTKAPPEFIAQFDGQTVAYMIYAKITHMGLTTPHLWVPLVVTLKIAGQLYDGTPWKGTGTIKVYIPDSGPGPSPP